MGWLSKLGLGGWVGDIGKSLESKEVNPQQVNEPSYYPKLRESIAKRLQTYIDEGPEKYGGQRVAPMSEQEQQSLGYLSEYGAQGQPSIIGEGAAEISKTLANQYDPETSAYFQAFRNQRLRDLELSKTRLGNDLAGAGAFWHAGRQTATKELEEQAGRDIGSQNAALAESERGRRFAATGKALEYGQYQEGGPLRKAAALQQYGALPRQIDQAGLDATYQEFMRQISQGRADLGQASGFAGETPYAYPQYQDSTFMQLIKALAPAAGAAIGRG